MKRNPNKPSGHEDEGMRVATPFAPAATPPSNLPPPLPQPPLLQSEPWHVTLTSTGFLDILRREIEGIQPFPQGPIWEAKHRGFYFDIVWILPRDDPNHTVNTEVSGFTASNAVPLFVCSGADPLAIPEPRNTQVP